MSTLKEIAIEFLLTERLRLIVPTVSQKEGTTAQGDSPKDLTGFVRTLLRESKITCEELIVASLYLDRLHEQQPNLWEKCHRDSTIAHRLIITALVLACKYLDDECRPNDDWAAISGQFSIAEVNQMELDFMSLCGFNLYVDAQKYVERCEAFKHHTFLSTGRKSSLNPTRHFGATVFGTTPPTTVLLSTSAAQRLGAAPLGSYPPPPTCDGYLQKHLELLRSSGGLAETVDSDSDCEDDVTSVCDRASRAAPACTLPAGASGVLDPEVAPMVVTCAPTTTTSTCTPIASTCPSPRMAAPAVTRVTRRSPPVSPGLAAFRRGDGTPVRLPRLQPRNFPFCIDDVDVSCDEDEDDFVYGIDDEEYSEAEDEPVLYPVPRIYVASPRHGSLPRSGVRIGSLGSDAGRAVVEEFVAEASTQLGVDGAAIDRKRKRCDSGCGSVSMRTGMDVYSPVVPIAKRRCWDPTDFGLPIAGLEIDVA